MIRWFTNNGIELEADLRHSELIVAQLGLKDAKELTCPAAEEVKRRKILHLPF